MGGNSSSGGGGNNRESQSVNQYSQAARQREEKAKAAAKEKAKAAAKAKAKAAVKNVANFVKGGGIVGAAVRGITSAVKKAKVNKSLIGTSDYQGSKTKSNIGDTGRRNGGGAMTTSGQVVQAPKPIISPTTAEVSQSQAIAASAPAPASTPAPAEAPKVEAAPAVTTKAEEDITLRKKRILAKGRSLTIMTSPRGVQTGSLTLGRPSLLGR